MTTTTRFGCAPHQGCQRSPGLGTKTCAFWQYVPHNAAQSQPVRWSLDSPGTFGLVLELAGPPLQGSLLDWPRAPSDSQVQAIPTGIQQDPLGWTCEALSGDTEAEDDAAVGRLG